MAAPRAAAGADRRRWPAPAFPSSGTYCVTNDPSHRCQTPTPCRGRTCTSCSGASASTPSPAPDGSPASLAQPTKPRRSSSTTPRCTRPGRTTPVRSRDDWRSRLAQLTKDTKVVKITRKEGSFGSRVEKVVAVLTFPDGSTREGPTADISTMLEEECVRLHGEEPYVPTQEQDYDIWLVETGAVGIEQRGLGRHRDRTRRQRARVRGGSRGVALRRPARRHQRRAQPPRRRRLGGRVGQRGQGPVPRLGFRDESYPARIRYLLGRDEEQAAARSSEAEGATAN